jgi:hypothetical protein
MRVVPTEEMRSMLEEELDPRPPRDCFAATIAARAAGRNQSPADVTGWLGHWVDRDDLWLHLRATEHWIARADS